MYIVCELCKARSPFGLKIDARSSYCWSNSSYSEWLVHILSDIHQHNSLTRLHETLATTRNLPLEEDEDIEICYYPQASSLIVQGKFPLETISDKSHLIKDFFQYGLIRDLTFLPCETETAYIVVFELSSLPDEISGESCVADQNVSVKRFTYKQCNSIVGDFPALALPLNNDNDSLVDNSDACIT